MDLTQPADLQIGLRNRCYPGEPASGDLPFFFHDEEAALIGIVDGLGHGQKAHDASARVQHYLGGHLHRGLLAMFENLNRELKGSVGAAVGMACIELGTGKFDYAGVGNTCCYIFGDAKSQFVSTDGVVGQHMRTPLLQSQMLDRGDKVILTTDGIQERFYNESSPHDAEGKPDVVADRIVGEYGKVHDDASCLVFEF